jgi:hypothetical protein
MSYIVCDSCGYAYSRLEWDGQWIARHDWTMCSQCEFDGALDALDELVG